MPRCNNDLSELSLYDVHQMLDTIAEGDRQGDNLINDTSLITACFACRYEKDINQPSRGSIGPRANVVHTFTAKEHASGNW